MQLFGPTKLSGEIMDGLRATPYRSPIAGTANDILGGLLGYMRDPRRTQQMQGLAGLLESTGIPKTVERFAYGEPLTNIQQANVPALRPETANALLTLLPNLPMAGKAIQATKGLPVGMSIKDVSYRGSHVPPNAKTYGATLDDLGKIMPTDVYSSKGKNLYGIGDNQIDSEWFKAAYLSKGNPDKLVEIYRAVPKGIKDINEGDWVTTSKTYAKNHGENTLGGDYEIVSRKVKANTLSSEGYPYEFGYNSNEVAATPSASMQGLLGANPRPFETSSVDASDIFGQGAKRIKYIDPNSGGVIDVLQRPDGTASVLGLEVPEAMRGQGIGQSLQSQVMQDFPEMMGQVSSKAAAKTAYRLGRRPPNQPDATLDDVYKIMDEYSSVNLVSPDMQKRFMQSLLD